jgi:hypothetical protein
MWKCRYVRHDRPLTLKRKTQPTRRIDIGAKLVRLLVMSSTTGLSMGILVASDLKRIRELNCDSDDDIVD